MRLKTVGFLVVGAAALIGGSFAFKAWYRKTQFVEVPFAEEPVESKPAPPKATVERPKEILVDDEPVEEDEEEEPKLKKGIDPNSPEAWKQYTTMLFADVHEYQTLEIVDVLLGMEFKVISDVDGRIYDSLKGDRLAFFGANSAYSDGPVSVAEFFLYFAKLMDYDVGRGVDYWMSTYFGNMDFYALFANGFLESLGHNVELLLAHDYSGPEGWGMFALNPSSSGWYEPSFMKQYWGSDYIDLEEEDEEDGDTYEF